MNNHVVIVISPSSHLSHVFGGYSCANWFYHDWQYESVSALQAADEVKMGEKTLNTELLQANQMLNC